MLRWLEILKNEGGATFGSKIEKNYMSDNLPQSLAEILGQMYSSGIACPDIGRKFVRLGYVEMFDSAGREVTAKTRLEDDDYFVFWTKPGKIVAQALPNLPQEKDGRVSPVFWYAPESLFPLVSAMGRMPITSLDFPHVYDGVSCQACQEAGIFKKPDLSEQPEYKPLELTEAGKKLAAAIALADAKVRRERMAVDACQKPVRTFLKKQWHRLAALKI